MRNFAPKFSLVIGLALLTLGSTSLAQSVKTDFSKTFSTLVDKDGNIAKPRGVRDSYATLGAFTVIDPKGNQIHQTYATPGTAAYYRKTGKMPDGAVLVKEVFGTSHGALTTGEANWAADTKVWFVMIKDEKNRFPKNKLWGEGWGWALFKSDAPDKQVATDFKTDCLGCHIPAKSTDYTYVRGYPVLKAE